MSAPETPAAVVETPGTAAAGATDASDLAAILDDDQRIDALRLDLEAHRQAIADRLGLDAVAPVMLALSRLSGLAQQIASATAAAEIEVRFISHHLGGA